MAATRTALAHRLRILTSSAARTHNQHVSKRDLTPSEAAPGSKMQTANGRLAPVRDRIVAALGQQDWTTLCALLPDYHSTA